MMNIIDEVELKSGGQAQFGWRPGQVMTLMPNGANKWILHDGRVPLAVLSGVGPYRLSILGSPETAATDEDWRALVAPFLHRL